MPTEKPRFSVTFQDDSFSKIKRYQAENKISTQSKAVSQLVELALSDIEKSMESPKTPSLSDEAQKVGLRYSKLDIYGKAAVQAVMSEEETRIKEQAELDLPLTKPEPKIIPFYTVPAAAGYASPIFGSDYDMYELTDKDPQGAMFAIKVQGDSMEPYFPDGSMVFCNKDPIHNGEIGVFCLDGDSYIKQYYKDPLGMVYLFSLNRDRADADKFLYPSSNQMLACLGRVITRQRFQLPR